MKRQERRLELENFLIVAVFNFRFAKLSLCEYLIWWLVQL